MGNMKRFIEDWLERVGYEEGYDWENLPTIDVMINELYDWKRYKEKANKK